MKTDLFQSCDHCWVFQICWHIECSTFTASSFRIWNSSTGIPSPPLALFVVMLPKAHLTSHSSFHSNPKERQCQKMFNTHTQKSLSRVRLFATPWIVAYQAPQSMRFSRHEYWSGLLFPSPKSFLMKVKEESEKAGLTFSIQKRKNMASSPNTSWQIEGDTMEAVIDFVFLCSKITADDHHSHEIKRCLLLGRKAMTNLDSILKSRSITLHKCLSSQNYGFSSGHVWMWELDYKKKLSIKELML